jgi:hypothetical protein
VLAEKGARWVRGKKSRGREVFCSDGEVFPEGLPKGESAPLRGGSADWKSLNKHH